MTYAHFQVSAAVCSNVANRIDEARVVDQDKLEELFKWLVNLRLELA